MEEIFVQFSLLLLASAVAGLLAMWLHQPVLIAYIVVGIVAGPAGFGWVAAQGEIDLLAQLGVAVLLFAVGLKLDLQNVRQIGRVALATGLGQLAFTIGCGWLLCRVLGRPPLEALYLAVALTFSSTIIVVKLLGDKRELDALHGRIAVGFLIVQDLAVVIAMMGMAALRTGGDEGVASVLGMLLLRVLGAGLILYVLMRYVLRAVARRIARSQELLLIFAVAWGASLAALGEWAGFSKEAGAFLAGFSLASTGYRDAIHARLSGLRDFLLLFFFLDLGARLDLSTLGSELAPALLLSLFVLIGNPLIVMAIMGAMGYRRRTGFLAGLTVAQISEFSIIFVAMGVSLGHVGAQTLGLTTLVGLVTIALSTYAILYSHPLYERLAPWLRVFERRDTGREQQLRAAAAGAQAAEVIVFGLGRYGARLALRLRESGVTVVGVDFDPERIARLAGRGLMLRYGDATDVDFVASLPLRRAGWVVSTLDGIAGNRALLHALGVAGHRGRLAVVARHSGEDAELASCGASLVLDPLCDAAEEAARTIGERVRSMRRDAA